MIYCSVSHKNTSLHAGLTVGKRHETWPERDANFNTNVLKSLMRHVRDATAEGSDDGKFYILNSLNIR